MAITSYVFEGWGNVEIKQPKPTYNSVIPELYARLLHALKFINLIIDKNKFDINEISLIIDFNKVNSLSNFKAYIIKNKIIYNCAALTTSCYVFFPVTNEPTHKGIKYECFLDFFSKKQIVIINIKENTVNNKLYNFECEVYNSYEEIDVNDEYGTIFPIKDIVNLAVNIEIPQNLKHYYNLIDTKCNFYKTPKDFYCVLYAELDTENNQNLIRVLRWIPLKSYSDKYNYNRSSSHFYELGHLKNEESLELYNFMMKNNSRILFGSVKNSQITILGGINIFFKNQFEYPIQLQEINII